MGIEWPHGYTINAPLQPTHIYVPHLLTLLSFSYMRDPGNSQWRKEWYKRAKARITDAELDVKQWRTCITSLLLTLLSFSYMRDPGNSQWQKEWYKRAKARITDAELDVKQWRTCITSLLYARNMTS